MQLFIEYELLSYKILLYGQKSDENSILIKILFFFDRWWIYLWFILSASYQCLVHKKRISSYLFWFEDRFSLMLSSSGPAFNFVFKSPHHYWLESLRWLVTLDKYAREFLRQYKYRWIASITEQVDSCRSRTSATVFRIEQKPTELFYAPGLAFTAVLGNSATRTASSMYSRSMIQCLELIFLSLVANGLSNSIYRIIENCRGEKCSIEAHRLISKNCLAHISHIPIRAPLSYILSLITVAVPLIESEVTTRLIKNM